MSKDVLTDFMSAASLEEKSIIYWDSLCVPKGCLSVSALFTENMDVYRSRCLDYVCAVKFGFLSDTHREKFLLPNGLSL